MDTSNLKPFDLEAAKVGKPVLHVVRKLAALNITQVGNRIAFNLSEDGDYLYQAKLDGTNKGFPEVVLMMAPEEKTVWVNLYPLEENVRGIAGWYDSEEEADRRGSNNRMGGKAHKITYTE